jgi:hypothetical protein
MFPALVKKNMRETVSGGVAATEDARRQLIAQRLHAFFKSRKSPECWQRPHGSVQVQKEAIVRPDGSIAAIQADIAKIHQNLP